MLFPAVISVVRARMNAVTRLGIDIFRFDDEGRIVEHWDVLQVVPSSSKNDNGMF